MSKDTNNHPHSFPYAPSLPLGMGVPFPVLSHPMGQLVPMGVMPINSANLQGFMGDLSKMSVQSMQSASLFKHHSLSKSFDSPLPIHCEGSSSMTAKTGDSSDLAPGTKNAKEGSYPPFFGPFTGSLVPMMPSVVFLPYFSGYPGLPSFNSDCSTKMPQEMTGNEDITSEDGAESNMAETGSDELDVAQILVDMQGQSKHAINFAQTSNTRERTEQKLKDYGSVAVQPPKDDKNLHDEIKIDQKGESENLVSAENHSKDELKVEQNNKTEITTCDNNDVLLITKKVISHQEVQLGKTDSTSISTIEIKKEDKECEDLMLHSSTTDCEDTEGVKHENGPTSGENSFQDTGSEASHTKLLNKWQNEQNCEMMSQDTILESHAHESTSKSFLDQEATSITSLLKPTISNSQAMIIEDTGQCTQNTEKEQLNNVETLLIAETDTNEELCAEDKSGLKMTYKCHVCSQLFRSPLGLQKHIEFHTDDNHLFTCTICFTNFHNEASLQTHLSSHTKKRPHKCTFCPKAFRDPGSLQKHVRVHTGEKPYNCKDCSRSFAEYSSLRKHQRVHTGEQPYKCKYCSKAFSISGNLQRHILIHTGERPYKCNFCPKAFNNPSHLRRHVKNLHFKGESVIDEAMLSHYGNPVAKVTDEIIEEVTVETSADYDIFSETTEHKVEAQI